MMTLSGEIALVTGAGRGIGRAIALYLAQAGARVIVNDIDATTADAVTVEISRAGRRAVTAAFDVTDEAAVRRGIAAAESELAGPVDVLVNNAGIGDFVSFPDITEAKWDAMLDTHLKGAFLCCRVLLPAMMQRHQGKIINVSSVAGKRGDFIGNAHYTAAKAGIIGLTRSLGAFAAPHGVYVNAIAPGIVDTELSRGMSPEHKATTIGRIPLGRFARPDEIAAVVTFLASEAASYIVGETVAVNGGSYLD